MSAPQFDTILYEAQDGVCTITLNKPDKLNAFEGVMMKELIAAFDQVDADDAVRAVIVTGAGKAFCAGMDISKGVDAFDRSKLDPEEQKEARVGGVFRDRGGRVSLRIYKCLKPVIAAVNGASMGVGATMQLPMDIRLASVHAKFGFVFSRRGVSPEAASSWFLPRAVGMQTALEWCYTGRVVSAEEALHAGLVRSIHPADELMPAARALAVEIAANTAPLSIAAIRQMMWRGLGARHPMEAHRADSRAMEQLGQTPDAKEALGAFFEKREAHYAGRVSQDFPDLFPHWEEPEFI
jgi:enoyl-CoA hydratase/carnithine racemase